MDYNVFPTLVGQRWGKWQMRFEGRTAHETLPGLAVIGSIELLDPGEKVGLLFDQWKNAPKAFEGYGFLVHEKGTPAAAACFMFTLYGKAEAVEWIQRAFHFGLGSVHGELGIEIVISFPDPVELDFWRERWRRERWAVASWKMMSRLDASA